MFARTAEKKIRDFPKFLLKIKNEKEYIPIVKKRTVLWMAMGVYCNLAASIDFSVISATLCFASISLARFLDELSILMAVSSSRIFPSTVCRTLRISSSISFNFLRENRCWIVDERRKNE